MSGLLDRLASLFGGAAGRDDAGASRGCTAVDALVYRGPASLPGCPEALAATLERAGLRVQFVGPRERRELSARNLADCRIYAQPGGPDLDGAWRHLSAEAAAVRSFVRDGGRYLGICLGGYLAGHTPGFGLLPGDTDQYIGSGGCEVDHEDDTVLTVRWRGVERDVFFQDGPYFAVDEERVETIATYRNGLPAALRCRYGRGVVTVAGPHPEATRDWFTDARLQPPHPYPGDLADDLVHSLLTP